MSTVIESDWENNRLKEECESLRQQLVAAQLQNTQLREALHYSLGAWHYDGVSDEHGSIFQEANNRCDQPTDTSALEALIAKAGECMRERCVKHCDEAESQYFDGYEFRNVLPSDLCEEIRAIPSVKLEDIK